MNSAIKCETELLLSFCFFHTILCQICFFYSLKKIAGHKEANLITSETESYVIYSPVAPITKLPQGQ